MYGKIGAFFSHRNLGQHLLTKSAKISNEAEKFTKKWVNLREVQNDGGFMQYKLFDHDMVSKTLPGDVFSYTIAYMKISNKFMNNVFLNSFNIFVKNMIHMK